MMRRAPWVVLFSGPMLDEPRCGTERFPADMAPLAAAEIALRLAILNAGPGDLALCNGACGGALLFAEAALARGMRLELRLPCDEERFLYDCVACAGRAWLMRYAQVRAHPDTVVYCLPEEAVPAGGDPFEETDRWQLGAALAHGADQLWLMALWDGMRATARLMETVDRYTGQVIIIDAARLLRRTRERRRN